ncbi:MAG: hypothetical protein ABGY75_20230 [Gemmataceae bacterium]
MSFLPALTTGAVLDEFTDVVADRGGSVSGVFYDGTRLFARSVLPAVDKVRRTDAFQGGVAVRATENDVWLYPFLFRQVCTNGAVITQTLDARHIPDLHDLDPDVAAELVREGVAACCAPEVFRANMDHVRTAAEQQADLALLLLPALGRFPEAANAHVLQQILRTFSDDRDGTRFGLMNAVTANAREAADPEVRWRLEELGGALAVGVPFEPRHRPPAARLREVAEIG